MEQDAIPKFKNPQRLALFKWIFADLFFIILALHSYITFDIHSYDGLFIMVSITVVLTSLFFIRTTMKNIKVLDEAINRKIMIVHWKYTNEEWLDYLLHEEDYRSNQGRLMAIFLSVVTAIIFIPFILFIPEGKFFMFMVMLGLYGLYFFMGYIFPSILFYLKRKSVGEVILLEKGVLLNKEFHTWDFPLSKFNSAELKEKPYFHLAITYDFVDRTGPRSYTVNVPIPRKNTKDIKNIISSFN
ncbi:hypothetical protein [uncultured Methanolobus sp.]|uniref:hypothetical protein n=1 Tax=uncultured Methanolobus sp. TaxID=218300 RepID=UPI002AAAE2F7|nr:hypothetical protein [uncultured Methanolobus sp.]